MQAWKHKLNHWMLEKPETEREGGRGKGEGREKLRKKENKEVSYLGLSKCPQKVL